MCCQNYRKKKKTNRKKGHVLSHVTCIQYLKHFFQGVETVPDWSDELWADRDMRTLHAWLSPTAESVGADFFDLDMHVEADPYFGTEKYFVGSIKTLPTILPPGGFIPALHEALVASNNNE